MEVKELYSLFEEYNVPFYGVRLPKYEVSPEDKKGLPDNITNADFLTHLARLGMDKRGFTGKQIYEDRLKYELGIVIDLGFVDYFLLVWDVVNFCHKQKIAIGAGRGSCAGSLILHLINITLLDPIKYKFYFERFISKTRAKKTVIDGVTYLDGSLMCDVDLDFCVFRRHEVEEYVNQKFKGRTSKVANISTYSGKSLIKDCAKILANVKESEANELSNRIEKRFGVTADLKKTYESDESFKKWADENPRVFKTALKLRDLNKNKSVHASALLVCHDKVENLFPTEFSSKEQVTLSSYTKDGAGSIAVKLDLLGLNTVTIIDDVCKSVGINASEIDYENPFIYQQFQDLKTPKGIFQIEAATCYGASQKVKPRNLNHLSVVSALARPGGLPHIDAFAKYNETGTTTPVHEFFNDILEDTGHIVAFQEQTMAMIHKIGFSLDEAEQVRRCVTGDTLFVSKQRGWISINELLKTGYQNDDFLIMDENGQQSYQKIKEIWSTGNHQIRYVQSDHGLSVKATRRHQFLTDTGWKSRACLSEEDYLVCANITPYDGKDVISKEMALVIVGLVTEGYFTSYNQCHFTNWDAEVMEYFQENFEKEFKQKATYHKGNQKVALIKREISSQINKYLDYGLSVSKFLPKELMGMSLETTKEIIGFLYTCEGSFYKGANQVIEFSSASEKLVQQVQLLLLRYGVISFIGTSYNKKYQKQYYKLTITDYANQIKFKENFYKYLSTQKQIDFDKNITPRNGRINKVIIPSSITKKFINQYSFLLNKSSGRFFKNNISKNKFSEFVNQTNDFQWKQFINGNQFYSKIKSLKNHIREVEVFDFSMQDETKPYIVANGMVIHNCIGKKKIDEIKSWEEKIKNKIKERGLDTKIGTALWDVVNASANYSFNKCLALDTKVITKNGKRSISKIKIGDLVKCYDVKSKRDIYCPVKEVYRSNAVLYEVWFDDWKSIKCSMLHKIMTINNGLQPLYSILTNDFAVLSDPEDSCGKGVKVIGIDRLGNKKSIDLNIDNENHNFYANDIVVSNSHSTSYSAISAITCYLKFKYPLHFFTSLLKYSKDMQEITIIERELHHFNIKLLPPDLKKSEENFAIEGGNIRFGLRSIKGFGGVVQKMAALRGEFTNNLAIFDAARQCKVNIGQLSALIQAGAIESTRDRRSYYVLQAQLWNILNDTERKAGWLIAESCECDVLNIVRKLKVMLDKTGKKPIISEKRAKTILTKYEPHQKIYQQNHKNESLANWYYETSLIGYSFSSSLKNVFKTKTSGLITLTELDFVPNDQSIKVVCVVDEIRQSVAKNEKKTKYLRLTVSDETATYKILMFNNRFQDKIEDCKNMNKGKLPKEGNIVIVLGDKKNDCVYADMISVQDYVIYTKHTQLEKEEKVEEEPSY